MIALSRISFKFLFAIVAVAALSGCLRQKAVFNVQDRTFPITVAESLTLDEVAKAISSAGYTRKESWNFTRVSANVFTANLSVRNKHSATVRIPFSAEKFSIIYEGSSGLLYDGSTIHYNYNKWVRNLSSDISNVVMQAALAK